MNQNFSELIEYLDEKFSVIGKRFEKIEGDFRNLQSAVNAYAKKADTYFQEMTMLSGHVNRHEAWIEKASGKGVC